MVAVASGPFRVVELAGANASAQRCHGQSVERVDEVRVTDMAGLDAAAVTEATVIGEVPA